MSTLMDVAGSIVLFGAVLLVVLKLNTSLLESGNQQGLTTASQELLAGGNGAGLAPILQRDFNALGAAGANPFVIADSNRITFRGDLNADGVVDSVKYSLVALPVPPGGNPNLKYRLLRRQNTEPGINGGIGVSLFRLSYCDSLGRLLPTPVPAGQLARIRSVKVQVRVENAVRVKNDRDTTFASAFYERTFSPRNLRAVR